MKIILTIFVFLLTLSLMSCKAMMGGMMMSDNKSAKNAPPAHAPAHGRRARIAVHEYYYYPDYYVYYDIHDRVYFYLADSHWIMSPTLPGHYILNDHRVSLKMESDIPYSKYQNHKKKYPKNVRKKHKRKFKKAKKHK